MNDVRITQEIRDRLQQLESDHGTITPEVVVSDAKNTDSPLHGLFDWNTEQAAHRYWLHRAREIIKSVRLVSATTETLIIDAPHYVRDPSVASKEQGYISVVQLQKHPDQARGSLKLEFARVEGALTRARALAVALDMTEDIESLIEHAVRVRERAEAA